MHARQAKILLCVVAGLVLGAVPLHSAETARLTVHLDRPGPKISPMLYGIFFEEINRAGDGGLYAEMLQNRSFEDDRAGNENRPAKAPGWTLVSGPGAEATMAIDRSRPLGAKNPHSLRLEIAKTGGGRAGVANEGFHGIAVRKGTEYAFSVYLRSDSRFQGPLTVSLEESGGRELGSATIRGIGTAWKKFACMLTAGETSAAARLVLAAASPGTLWIDQASLFPKETWKGRANGLRPDLAEMLYQMKPAFVRFPGGCYVEGDRLPNAFRWKQSIGDPAQRPGHWNLWGYRSTDGLGYHEYLQMCEDLGAEPLFVINCGMSHEEQGRQGVAEVPNLAEYVQDALDAVEYANGPVESRWGALRAKAGHPAPFGLKYMEIGNENGGPTYDEHYKLFYDAIKAKYPEMNLVANCMTRPGPVEINDEHYYNSPEFFFQSAEKYDTYPRSGPKVYVGEYAVTQGCGKGNLRAALGEAAFMTGMERNSDVVVMASYAPLFVNVGWRQWNPDAIQFDNSRVCGTPSYYVQKMFSQARGDVVLGLDVESPPVEVAGRGGAVGVGTWATQAEFKDLKVTQGDKVLFQSDFSQGTKGWRTLGGRWQTQDGALRQTAGGENIRAIAGDKAWKDYTYTLKARKLGGAEGFLILFNVQDDQAKSWWNLGGWGNNRHAVESEGVGDGGVDGRIETGRWYDIRIELKGSHIRCFLDGKLIHDLHPAARSLYAVASRAGKSGDVILKVVNVADEAQPAELAFRGPGAAVKSAVATVLTSASAEDENTLDQPAKVVPVTAAVAGAAADFRHVFPAHSVTIMTTELAPSPVAAALPANLALVAKPTTSFVSGHESLQAVNDGYLPVDSNDKKHGAYGNWPQKGTQWVEYEWSQPISTDKIDVYWFDDGRGVRLPKACRLKYWDGKAFVPVENPVGLGLAANRFNTTTFNEVRTPRLRLELDSNGDFSTGILEWRVYDSGKSPNFAPVVTAGPDRVVVLPGKTWLQGTIRDDGKVKPVPRLTWSKQSGPGEVAFEDAHAVATSAGFSAAGEYVLRLTAGDGQLSASDAVHVTVVPPPPATHLAPAAVHAFKIYSPLWRDRTKKLIVNWIPHCYNKLSDPKLPEGGIENFVQAGNKLAGRPHKGHVGAVFANAYVHNTVESMCVALTVDPQGDEEIISAQKAIRAKLADWIPKLLSAQEPDGYLQTCYTLNNLKRWSNKDDHEGYQAGYFIESAIAHYLMTSKTDDRMYRAARKLADCWCENIGPPPKRRWYDGHEELEQALVRLAQVVEDVEGAGKGRKYVALAKFLLDCRGGGQEYDQSHLPVVRQYEAVGHAVRAAYCYSGMAAVAMQTGDPDYLSAAQSLWSNLVHRKYYVTGGIGSGETPEGFGPNYSLPNNAYCESCANCGELFFQHKLNLIWHDARYADLGEETLYNAILGDVDLEARNFTYTNALDCGGARYPWHGCPCCVGNIPRTLLMLPTWMYAKSAESLYVNLFLGSTATVDDVAGTTVRMVQTTDYPWSGKVSITLNPSAEKRFALRIRVPSRGVSKLYTAAPACKGITSLALNGAPVPPVVDRGYAVIDRTWQAGDRIDLELPMPVQRVKADPRVTADVGRVALRRGPLVYCIESIDQNVDLALAPAASLSTRWRSDLLGGVVVLTGSFADGAPLTAIPYYARNNRGGRAIVWIQEH